MTFELSSSSNRNATKFPPQEKAIDSEKERENVSGEGKTTRLREQEVGEEDEARMLVRLIQTYR